MKIIIPIKRVLDPYTQARVNKQTQLVDLTNAKMAMNPFCEIAVEEALKIKESGAASETIAVSIGSEKTIDELQNRIGGNPKTYPNFKRVSSVLARFEFVVRFAKEGIKKSY